jgi:3-dehydroquinate synthase
MSLTSDRELFSVFENEEFTDEVIEKTVIAALKIKKNVVESDERESGIRKILNFGHTLGHAIEAEEEMRGFYHGECVALGMLPVISPAIKSRLTGVLKKLSLPTEYRGNLESALKYVTHDKKCDGNKISVVFVDSIGSYRIEKIGTDEFAELVRENM